MLFELNAFVPRFATDNIFMEIYRRPTENGREVKAINARGVV